jgi:MFS family permease
LERNNLQLNLNFLSTPRKRLFLFALLYASEGAPIGFIWWTLPTELRTLGVPVNEITALTSLLVLPWTLKFLWAPLVDMFRSSRWTLRSWIIVAQWMMGLSLLPMVFLDISANYSLIVFLFLLHTVSASTQDVAIDALCISEVPDSERGAVNGWMQAGMLAGRALFGGGAIVLTQYLNLKSILVLLILFIITIAAVMIFAQPQAHGHLTNRQKDFVEHFRNMIRSRRLWIGLLFAVIGGTAYESVGAVAGPMFVDSGFSKDQIGFFFSVLSIGAMLAGALIGGYAVRRFGLWLFVKISVALIVLVVVLLSALLSSGGIIDHTLLMAVMTLLYFGIGLFTATTYTMFMHLTDPALGATQFSTYMGGTNLCESLSAYSVGILVTNFGYPSAFVVMGLVSLLSLGLVYRLEKQQL